MKIEFLPIDQIAFFDVNGVSRRSRGCSLLGLDEFNALYQKLEKILKESDPNLTIEHLYLNDDQFRYCCDRILELNNINPQWINATILTGLIFSYEGKHGLLIRLNTPEQNKKGGEGGGTKSAIEALCKATNNLKDALEIADTIPWKHLINIIGEKTDTRDKKDILKDMMQGMSVINMEKANAQT